MLFYFWLESVELAKSRVLDRVNKGGHNIHPETIDRRYKRGIKNFFQLYQSIVDSWIIYNNSRELPYPIAKGNGNQVISIYNHDIWKSIV